MPNICNLLRNYATQAIQVITPRTPEEKGALMLTCVSAVFSRLAGIVLGACYSGCKLFYAKKIIEISPTLEINDDFTSYTGKIAMLAKRSDVIGVAVVPVRESDRYSPVYIISEPFGKGKGCPTKHYHQITVFDLDTDIKVGYIIIKLFSNENNYLLTDDTTAPLPRKYKGYGDSPLNVNKILIKEIRNSTGKRLENLGSLLTKIVIQVFKDQFIGRTFVEAAQNEISFWRSLGFFVTNQKKHPETICMHLPVITRREWLKTVRDQPILPPQKLLTLMQEHNKISCLQILHKRFGHD